MKKITLFIIASLLTLTSCDKEQSGAVYEGDSGFAFAAGVLNVETVSEDDGKVLVPVFRGDKSFNGVQVSFEFDTSEGGASEPVWESEDPEGIFSLTSQRAVFADNSFSTNIQVRYKDIESLNPNRKYRMRLTLKDSLSPSGRGSVIVTVSRKLSFEKYGDATYMDYCMFDNAYDVELYKAKEADIFRVIDPYSKGLVAEEYAAEGLMQTPPEYVQFSCDPDGHIYFEPFTTGMLVPTGAEAGKCMTWVYYPGEYKWGKDFSLFDADNKRLSDKEFQLYGVYCLPDLSYGFLNEGCYKIEIKVK